MTTYLTDCLPSCLYSLDHIDPVSVLFVATHCTSVVDGKIVFSSVLTSALHEAK